jgi:hypothetical protein
MLIKTVNKTTIDVFVGVGWDNWTRFEIMRDKGQKYLRHVAGDRADRETIVKLKARYCR